MTLTEVIITEFIESYSQKSNGQDISLRRRKRNGENDNARQTKCSKLERQQSRKILASLVRIANEFDKFMKDSSGVDKRFAELTSALALLLLGNDQENQQYPDAFKSVADELFSKDITWGRIVTFLVYNGEIALKVSKQTQGEEKTFTITSQIIDNVLEYFEENIMQWIDEQDGGWLDVIKYENEDKLDKINLPSTNISQSRTGTENGNGRYMRQAISVAALAAVIGGLYICSKLSVQ